MTFYRLRLQLRGPTATPWQADTIFGHLCWALRHRRGEEALRDFLGYFLKGLPPFLLSDGFPGNLLPRPLGMEFPRQKEKEVENFRQARDARKLSLISQADFQRAIQGEAFFPDEPPKEQRVTTRATLKNQINRLTGTTGQEGHLFPFTEHWASPVTIYLKVEEGFLDQVKELFSWLAETGYGKRKSVGYGAIKDIRWEDFAGFPTPPGANGFVSLSHFVPQATDPTQGRWRTLVKYGKLGEEFATGENPFKRPLLMLTPGSTFRDSPVREHYGRMVTGVSQDHPEVVQYGYALPVPMRYAERRAPP